MDLPKLKNAVEKTKIKKIPNAYIKIFFKSTMNKTVKIKNIKKRPIDVLSPER